MENKELETWLKETKAKNLSRYDLEKYIVGHSTCPDDLYKSLRNEFKLKGGESLTDYLFNQWQKEAEFSPKRGDRVLVWDDNEDKAHERIFLADIKGSSYPITVVGVDHENKFVNNEAFASTVFMNMKPLPTEQPTETDFKSKVIDLIEKRINICNESIEEYKNENRFYAAEVWKNCKIENQELLKQIKDLC